MKSKANGYFDWASCNSNASTMSAATAFFVEQGYVVFTSFCTKAETSSLRSQAEKIIDDFHKPSSTPSPATVFTTDDQDRQKDNEYFARSASRISCFLEEKQEGDAGPPAINKIGHALHDLDPVFAPFSRQDKLREVAKALGAAGSLLVQSMYIVKGARVGGKVSPHRDASYLLAKEGVCLGYWWALQDANEENACLWAVPRSHRDGRMVRQFVQKDGKMEYEGGDELDAYADEKYVSLPVQEGDLVMMNGKTVHKSEDNCSEKSRHAYALHVAKGGLEERGWLKREEGFPFRAF